MRHPAIRSLVNICEGSSTDVTNHEAVMLGSDVDGLIEREERRKLTEIPSNPLYLTHYARAVMVCNILRARRYSHLKT